jgi:predicted nuclease with TOPRIM domain
LSEKIDELEYTTDSQASDISQVENDNACLENIVDDLTSRVDELESRLDSLEE